MFESQHFEMVVSIFFSFSKKYCQRNGFNARYEWQPFL